MNETPGIDSRQLDLAAMRELLKLEHRDGKLFVADPIRKSRVRCTPEEFVRQLAVAWLISHYKLGRGSILIEKQLLAGTRHRRFDIVVLDKLLQPWMLVECKAPEVPIDDSTWRQATAYNTAVRAPHIWLTNGHSQILGSWNAQRMSFERQRFFPVKN